MDKACTNAKTKSDAQKTKIRKPQTSIKFLVFVNPPTSTQLW